MQGEFRGDFTRDTYDKSKHFLRVLMQQGRVQLDADFNEQTSILLNRLQTLAKDVFGLQGGPEQNCGFEFIATEEQINNINNINEQEKQKLKQLLQSEKYLIGKGNYYVDGILCENEEFVSYFHQPDFALEVIDHCKVQLNGATYLVYLDVWERHITAIEDRDDRKINIREVALGGADTATRSKLVWQVKLRQLKDNQDIETLAKQVTKDSDYFQSVLGQELLKPGKGELIARITKPSSTGMNDPCVIPFSSKFRGAENHLYRAEIFRVSPGNNNQLSLVWSRENSSIVFPIVASTESNSSVLVFKLEHLGKDKHSSLSAGDWVEIIDDDYVLENSDRHLLKVEQIDRIENQVILSGDSKSNTLVPEKHPLLRRWDSGEVKVNLSKVNNKWFPLEDGIEIQFPADTQNNFYQVGDYWLIPVRTATGNVEWPKRKNKEGKLEPQPQPPHGIAHYYAPLAVILGNPNNVIVHDCRRKIGNHENTIQFVSSKDNNTIPANSQENPVTPINQKETNTQTITEFNRIINASWHHDQVLEATIAEVQENSSNLPEDQLFNLKSQDLRNLFTKLGLVIQFQKSVRIDSLHKSSISVLAHTDNVLKGEVFYILPMKVEPVQVKKNEPKSIRWAIGNDILDSNINLITEVEPLTTENNGYTEAVRLITPDDWSQKAVFHQSNIYQFTVSLHGDWIMNEEPLFDSENFNLQGDLNKGIIPDGLRQQFQEKGNSLSPNIIWFTEKENLKWRLVDGGKIYILKLENNKLTASKIQALDGNNIWPGVPERFSGNGSEGGDWVSIIHIKT
ncbi:hypothetical protein A6769_28270 [Nostoc punctiforme NIES-2108]|uniref:Uncharacterized protein n=1 Tax=Nostoc punctiforme NIES-2108 TaxID=1356359 RepID=A0A367R7E7_NOSPU|nr:hypothetical protein A6769_28270 [Nostoc punctiforme NIES-2108]